MPLIPGARLGSYEIMGPLGAGGMGEVYRARDHRLNRDVAIKVLPDLFATDAERLSRFRREAQVLASLNHTNIAAIYGFEDHGASHALVLELVDGPTLADRIAEGPMPFAEALPLARQIASALDAAHDQGIIHRDLKPANIKIRDDGAVKVLDFGLAKAMASDADGPASGVSNSPTLTARATQLGMIIGTAAYMAPEQAKGRPVDRRADIWAFGVVLFEMLSGRRAFEGDDVSDVLASVLKTEPDWTKLPADLPSPVRRFLGRCLEKDPKRRLRDIGEGMWQLDESLAGAAAASSLSMAADASGARASAPSSPAAPVAWWRRVLPIAATAVATAVIVTIVSMLRTPSRPSAEPVRFQFLPAATAPLTSTSVYQDVAISHDGRTLVYGVLPQGNSAPQLHLRHLDQLEGALLRGAEGAMAPFTSPDDQWVGFIETTNQQRLKKVSVLGGASTLIAELKSTAAGAAWLTDGTIVLGSSNGGLIRVPDGGGTPVELTKPDAALRESAHRWPSAVAGTSIVLFTTSSGGAASMAGAGLAAVDVRTGKVTRLKIAGSAPRYVSTGHIVFATIDGSLRAVPFDLGRLETRGNPVPVVEGVGIKPSGAGNFAVTQDGTLIYTRGVGLFADRSLAWVDRTGREAPIRAPLRNYYYARVSPNGARLSLDIRDQEQDVWIWDDRGTLMRLTADSDSDQYGLWTPNGQHLVFQSNRGQKAGLYIVRADGIGNPELLAERTGAFPNAVTPDGKSVIFRAATATKNDLFMVDIAGDRTVKPLLVTEHDESNAALSDDGRWMAYQSDLSGQMEIWARPFPDVNAGQVLVSTKGGSEPVWAPGSRELFYLSADNKIMSVAMSIGRELVPAAPVALFDASPYFFGGQGRNYDIAPGGKRFVMVKNPASATASEPITIVLNWASELARVK